MSIDKAAKYMGVEKQEAEDLLLDVLLGTGTLGRRPSNLRYLMLIARLTARRSTCTRARVGCVLADDGLETFVVGYNGGPKGGINVCRRETPGNCGCVHAEMNAVAKAPRGSKVAFLTLWPCERCAVMLVNAGVIRLYYDVGEYRNRDGLVVLDEVGIPHSLLPVEG